MAAPRIALIHATDKRTTRVRNPGTQLSMKKSR